MTATLSLIPTFTKYKEVKCYTLKVSGREDSEFLDFIKRMNKKLKDKSELGEVLRHIENIADKWGIARSLERKHLKKEDKAHRFLLPVKSHNKKNSKYGLRLYCVILGPKTLLILNGDLKTAQWVGDCKNCLTHFDFANNVANAIEKDKKAGVIGTDEKGFIERDDDYKLFI